MMADNFPELIKKSFISQIWEAKYVPIKIKLNKSILYTHWGEITEH